MATSTKTDNQFSLKLDLRVVTVVLLSVIAVMLVLWKPWETTTATTKTISVTGETVIKAEPNEFVFYPTYEFKGTDRTEMTNQAIAKNEEVVNKLKELGVEDASIKSSTNSYDWYWMEDNDELTVSTSLTLTIDGKELAQKVQDYLITTSPSGQISPVPQFSTEKQKELEDEAREEAILDAKAKAEQMASNLDLKLGKVQSVKDGNTFDFPIAYQGEAMMGMAEDASLSTRSLEIQPGENEYTYSVTVEYAIK